MALRPRVGKGRLIGVNPLPFSGTGLSATKATPGPVRIAVCLFPVEVYKTSIMPGVLFSHGVGYRSEISFDNLRRAEPSVINEEKILFQSVDCQTVAELFDASHEFNDMSMLLRQH